MRIFIGNILFICCLFIGITNHHSLAQCTPDQSYMVTGVYPDTVATGTVDQNYTGVIDFRTPPKDTLLLGIPATIDSVVIDGISGLPNGFSLDCNIPNCQYLPATNGCAAITGLPTAGSEGDYPLEVYVTTYFKIANIQGSQTDTADQFILKICPTQGCPLSVAPQIGLQNASNFKVVPNPIKGIGVISFSSNNRHDYKISVTNIIGQELISYYYAGIGGENQISVDFSGFVPGNYVVHLITEGTRMSQKIVITE